MDAESAIDGGQLPDDVGQYAASQEGGCSGEVLRFAFASYNRAYRKRRDGVRV